MNIDRELLSKPGDTILETIEYMRMSQVELAERLGKTPSKVHELISGKEAITVSTAIQLERVLGIDAKFWLNRETIYREKLSRIEQEEVLESYVGWLKEQPITQLKQLGYIKRDKPDPLMVDELLQFYGVVSPNQWESVYIKDFALTDFRRSQVSKTLLGSISAWLRIGELNFLKEDLVTFDKEGFKKALIEIKDIVQSQPEDYASKLKSICSSCGVALIYSHSIANAPISGATRWIGGNPLIQLTDRFKTNDHFWFTFFHEAGHILLHGKKDIFLEELSGFENDLQKENEANNFASNWLLPSSFTKDIQEPINDKEVRRLARVYNTHPAIVVGRLQYLKLVPQSFGSSFKMKINLDFFI